MRFTTFFLVALGGVALLGTGCAKPEQKFGRGLRNTLEVTRFGEMRREIEQATLFEGSAYGMTTGFIRGLNKTIARTGVGAYELVTFPIPPYDPVLTNYLSPGVVYPSNYRPTIPAVPGLDTDSYLGFSGGDIAPMVPGSRFRVFDN